MFNVLIEIVTIIWQAISGWFCGFIIRISEWLPVLQELKQTFSHCTPIRMWALFLGVPSVLISAAVKIAKILKEQN